MWSCWSKYVCGESFIYVFIVRMIVVGNGVNDVIIDVIGCVIVYREISVISVFVVYW